MTMLESPSNSMSPRSKKSFALTGLLVVLAIGVLWSITEGFTDGSLAPFTVPTLVAAMTVGAALGILDVYSLTNERLQLLRTDSGFIRLVIGGVLGLLAVILYNMLNISPILALIMIILFLVGELVGRAFYVFSG